MEFQLGEKIPSYRNRNKRTGEEQIFNTLKIIIKIEYFVGIFRFALLNEKLSRPNWRMKSISIFIITISVVWFFSFAAYNLELPGVDDVTSYKFMNLICITFMFLQFFVSASTTFTFNTSNICIISMLAKVDTMLKVENLSNFYKKSSLDTSIYLALVITTQILVNITDFLTVHISWAITAGFLDFVQRLEIAAFCIYVGLLKGRLNMVNHYLKTFVDDQGKKAATALTIVFRRGIIENFTFIGQVRENNTKIRDLAKIYVMIGQICSKVNEIFNMQILTILMNTFITMIDMMWTCLVMYRAPTSPKLGVLINVTLSCCTWISFIAMMSITCERFLYVRNETKILVNKIIMNYDLPTTMRDQAKAFMQLVEAWPLRIHIYDMFSVDISLTLSFISVATTYLIVLIQVIKFF
nr:uncharacterized protein LOC126056039 [Helicoverpa armigera]